MSASNDKRRQFLASGSSASLASMAVREALADAPTGAPADVPFFEYDYPSRPGEVTTLLYDPHLRVVTIVDGQWRDLTASGARE